VQEVFERRSPRLIVCMPPRHGKSLIVSKDWPAWFLGHHPDKEVIVASYAAELAEDHSRSTRGLIKSDLFRAAFPRCELSPDKSAVGKWQTTLGGGYRAAGVGGGITGMGAHIAIIDDPFKSREEALSAARRESVWGWYAVDLRTRVAPGGGILVMHTRWHEDDLVGRLLSPANDIGEHWDVLSYAALAEADEVHRKKGEALHPERWPADAMEKAIAAAGPYFGPALFQQRPVHIGGNIWKEAWFRYYDTMPERFDRIVQSWDCTFKDLSTSDFVAGQVWGVLGRNYYLLHRVCERLDIVATLDAIEATTRLFPSSAEVLVEDKANGTAVMRLLRGKVAGLTPVEPEGGKIARMVAASGPISEGRVYLPTATRNPGVLDYLNEVTKVPAAPHDDEADATSQFIIHAENGGGGIFIC
jgi:predicted phage terminase large subunit-like protein